MGDGSAKAMRIDNQAKVGLVTVASCLPGLCLSYVLHVEPESRSSPSCRSFLILPTSMPAAGGTYVFNKPHYWMAAVIALTLLDIAPFALENSFIPRSA